MEGKDAVGPMSYITMIRTMSDMKIYRYEEKPDRPGTYSRAA